LIAEISIDRARRRATQEYFGPAEEHTRAEGVGWAHLSEMICCFLGKRAKETGGRHLARTVREDQCKRQIKITSSGTVRAIGFNGGSSG